MPTKKTPSKAKSASSLAITEGVDAAIRMFSANPEAPAIHASSVAILASPVDFVIVIGQLETTPQGPTNKKVATLFFSPAHAKQLAMLLTEKVAEHEEQIGAIAPKFFATWHAE